MTSEAIVEFIESMVGPALQEFPANKDEKLAISLYSPKPVPAFEQLARRSRRLAHWHHQNTTSDKDFRMEVRHRNEEPFVLELTDGADTTDSQMAEFIRRHKVGEGITL